MGRHFNTSVAIRDLVRSSPLTEQHHLLLEAFGKRLRELEVHRGAGAGFHRVLGPTKMLKRTTLDPIVIRFGAIVRAIQVGLHQRVHLAMHEKVAALPIRIRQRFGILAIEIRHWLLLVSILDKKALEHQILSFLGGHVTQLVRWCGSNLKFAARKARITPRPLVLEGKCER